MARDVDPGSSPAAFLGAELRRARVAAGMSQEQFSRSLGFDRTVITKAETGERPPSPEVAAAIDEAFPRLDGLFSRLTLLARRANGRYPEWFREWVDAEQQATALRTWQPILVPGLLQTRDYARALFQAWQPTASSDDLDALVAARIERQAILDRAEPPELLAVLDVLPGAEDPHLGGVHDADEEPGISGGVVGKVPVHVGEVPDSRQIFGGDCCLRAGGSRERRRRLSRPGPWSAAGRGSAR